MRVLSDHDLRWIAGGLCSHNLYTSEEAWDTADTVRDAEAAMNDAAMAYYDADPNNGSAYAAAEAAYDAACSAYYSATSEINYSEICTDTLCNPNGGYGGQGGGYGGSYGSYGGGNGGANGAGSWRATEGGNAVVESIIDDSGNKDNLIEQMLDILGFDGQFGYQGSDPGRQWFWETWGNNENETLQGTNYCGGNVSVGISVSWGGVVDGVKDFLAKDSSATYTPGGSQATVIADQTTSHVRSAGETWTNMLLGMAFSAHEGASYQAGAFGQGTSGISPAEKHYNWAWTHPGWQSQPPENQPDIRDFMPGGALENNYYGPNAPYSISR